MYMYMYTFIPCTLYMYSTVYTEYMHTCTSQTNLEEHTKGQDVKLDWTFAVLVRHNYNFKKLHI